MHRPHFHKLPVPPATPSGARQTAPAADPSTAPAAGAESSNTFTAATGRGMDATREAHMGAPHVTAGVSAVTSAEFFTRRIGILEAQQGMAHNMYAPTLLETHRAIRDAVERGDEHRARLYGLHAARLVRRAQASAAQDLYGGSV